MIYCEHHRKGGKTMRQITGRYAAAIEYTDTIGESAPEQIQQLCGQSLVEGCSIRIMTDVHAGTG